jgi:hypothetical protein
MVEKMEADEIELAVIREDQMGDIVSKSDNFNLAAIEKDRILIRVSKNLLGRQVEYG